MKIETLSYDDLFNSEKENVPNNGNGKEYAAYIRVTFEDGTSRLFSDAMEPEDACFYRDLDWIAPLVQRAYEEGKNS